MSDYSYCNVDYYYYSYLALLLLLLLLMKLFLRGTAWDYIVLLGEEGNA